MHSSLPLSFYFSSILVTGSDPGINPVPSIAAARKIGIQSIEIVTGFGRQIIVDLIIYPNF